MPDFVNIKAWFVALAVFIGGAILVSGGTSADPPVPRGFPGVVPAFLAGAGTTGWDHKGEGKVALRRDRRWLARSRPLSRAAPRWARSMYRRSLLVLRALVDRSSGAALAGASPGWAYVWPRDAAAVAIALARAGYRKEARRVARFLAGLDLGAAARFDWNGEPVPGRGAQGDAVGWVAAAARASGLPVARPLRLRGSMGGVVGGTWRDRADYQEKSDGAYLGNAIASTAFEETKSRPHGGEPARRPTGSWIERNFGTQRGLARVAGDPGSGLDAAAAWAVRPFSTPALYPTVRPTLLRLVAEQGSRFGLLPSEDWDGGDDPWTAPTAWSAWALAALWRHDLRQGSRRAAMTDRDAALRLMADLRRAATPLGLLPERVEARTGLPASTTPLAWSHAFAILALRELWPTRSGRR